MLAKQKIKEYGIELTKPLPKSYNNGKSKDIRTRTKRKSSLHRQRGDVSSLRPKAKFAKVGIQREKDTSTS